MIQKPRYEPYFNQVFLLVSKNKGMIQLSASAAAPNEAQFYNNGTHEGKSQSSGGPNAGKGKSKFRDDSEDLFDSYFLKLFSKTVLKYYFGIF